MYGGALSNRLLMPAKKLVLPSMLGSVNPAWTSTCTYELTRREYGFTVPSGRLHNPPCAVVGSAVLEHSVKEETYRATAPAFTFWNTHSAPTLLLNCGSAPRSK